MNLIPIHRSPEENTKWMNDPYFSEIIMMCINFYNRIGYNPPWICYLVQDHQDCIGTAVYKGKPTDGKIEIAYGVNEAFRQKGYGTMICQKLTAMARKTDPTLIITARTLPESNYSTRILEKNKYTKKGTITDPEDGEVWEWIYSP
jgi:[ribosomal protein S5]-alanine N-acetyltransferase